MFTKLVAAGLAAISITAVGVYLASAPGTYSVFSSPSDLGSAEPSCCEVAKRSRCLEAVSTCSQKCPVMPPGESVASMVGGVAFAVASESPRD